MFGKVVEYEHTHTNGDVTKVFVKEELKGTHREHCLCYECGSLMNPDGTFKREGACPIAKELYQFVVRNGLVTPVFECPKFQPIQPV